MARVPPTVTVAVDLFDAIVRPPMVQIDGSSVNERAAAGGKVLLADAGSRSGPDIRRP